MVSNIIRSNTFQITDGTVEKHRDSSDLRRNLSCKSGWPYPRIFGLLSEPPQMETVHSESNAAYRVFLKNKRWENEPNFP